MVAAAAALLDHGGAAVPLETVAGPLRALAQPPGADGRSLVPYRLSQLHAVEGGRAMHLIPGPVPEPVPAGPGAQPPLPLNSDAKAAEVTGRLWAAISTAGGIHPAVAQPRHYPKVFGFPWIHTLWLPQHEPGPPGPPPALIDAHGQVERFPSHDAFSRSYVRWYRMLVREDMGFGRPGTWYSLAAGYLGRLAQCHLSVPAMDFHCCWRHEPPISHHYDTWYNAIIQISGTRTWHFGGGTLLAGSPQSPPPITTAQGDVLLIPKYLPYSSLTGNSRPHHLTFAIDRDTSNGM